MMIQQDSETFITDQTPLAAYLITEGFSLLDILYNGTKASYVFPNDSEALQASIKEFNLMRASTNASMLIQNYQGLIKRIRRGL